MILKLSKKRNTEEFVANVYRLKISLEQEISILNDKIENFYQVELKKINYIELANKYDGIYWTKNIISYATQMYYKLNHNNSIEIPTINQDIYSKYNLQNNYKIENDFIHYLKWLESDTLIIWNFDNAIIK